MRPDWVQLFEALDASNKTNDKVTALVNYFQSASPQDSLWMIALFTGRKPKKPLTATEMRQWAAEFLNIEIWLFEECYAVVGDIAETIALLFDTHKTELTFSFGLTQMMEEITQMQQCSAEEKRRLLLHYWRQLDKHSCFVFNKLLTGGFRIGVSQQLLVQALAKYLKREAAEITHRLMGKWTAYTHTFEDLLLSENKGDDASKPYPFYLAYPLETTPQELGDETHWQAEWKWDGIRVQLIKRNHQVFLWSRGEELINENFPELIAAAMQLPNETVLDGELLAYQDHQALPFGLLQKRITRKKPSAKMIATCPCAILAYDILEWQGEDIRSKPLSFRRQQLEQLLHGAGFGLIQLSPGIAFNTWEDLVEAREKSREIRTEGLMLKRKDAVYQSGRKRGDWWKWKVNAMSIDAVLVYAQKGHGRRADLYTDYTFALWHDGKLQTFTKAYSGLSDKEMVEVDQFVKKNTLEKFGPVRTVTPQLVFEIGFEGIQESSRHKCGVALRFPRIIRWRKDKKPEEANTLEELKKLA